MEVRVPQLPESVADATLVTWHRKVGDTVRRDENLVELETDKVVLEVPAPANGVIVEIRQNDGATVASGEVIAVIDPSQAASNQEMPDTAPAAATASDRGVAAAPAEPAAATQREPAAQPEPGVRPEPGAARPEPATGEARPERAAPSGAARMGPAVRNMLDEHDIDPEAISGTGRDGIITKADVLDYLARHGDTTTGLDADAGAAVQQVAAGGPQARRTEERVPMTRLRARIAERLVEAQATAAMLTTLNEIDMTEVMELRARYKEEFQRRHEVKLGFMSFFVRACVESLREFPLLNASVDGNDVVYHDYFDVGVAVSTDRGLVVPVLRDAQTMSFADIERSIVDYGERARSGSLGMEELTGGTFTITNGGVFGSLMSTPILNPPQSGILGMHKIEQRPVVLDGEIVARPMMYVALTYDHRIVDGRDAVQFLVHLKAQLEDPARLVLQV